MAGIFNARNTWFGVGVKFGGTVIGAGMESTSGYIFNLENPNHASGFTIESMRLGPGLGGSLFGGTIVFVLDCRSIFAIDGLQIDDWAVNVAFGAKLDGIVKLLRGAQEIDTIWPIARSMLGTLSHLRRGAGQAGRAAMPALQAMNLTTESFDKIKVATNYTWNAVNTYARSSDPVVLALDIPGTGYGVELTLTITQGKFTLF
jgi:hypothetical protein